jgi:hypothetical protein
MNFTMLFCMKFVLVGHSQVALSCAGCICKSQLAGCKKALKKPHIKMFMKLTPVVNFTNIFGAIALQLFHR